MSDAAEETGDCLEDQAYATIMENGWLEYDRFPLLEAEWPRIAQAIPLFLAGDNTSLQEVCDALQYFLNFTGRWDERLSLSREAETRALAAGDHENAGWRAYDAGFIHYLRGEASIVFACAARAAEHWTAAKAGPRERGNAIRLRGLGHQLLKDYPAAIAAYKEVLDLDRSLSPVSVDVASGLNDLADAEQLSGDYPAAEAHYQEALCDARAIKDAEGIASYTGNLAELALDREDWPAAEALAREALPLSEAIHRQELIALDNRRLALALVRQGRAVEALPHARKAVTIFEKLRSPDLAEARATLAECEAGVAGA